MCGRFTIVAPADSVRRAFDLPDEADAVWNALTPRYNVAPTQQVPVVRISASAEQPEVMHRNLRPMRWGLVPHWADDPKIGNRLINARCETVATKPAYRAAFRSRRCLVPATGFYEWQKLDAKTRQPWLIRRKGGAIFAFAGLWERWSPKEGGEAMDSFTVITGGANSVAGRIHDRMPVILPDSAWSTWLDPETDRRTLLDLLVPLPAEETEAFEVSRRVNSPRNEDPECVRPVL
jgi:putative SOS response-associated peptidase YedK